MNNNFWEDLAMIFMSEQSWVNIIGISPQEWPKNFVIHGNPYVFYFLHLLGLQHREMVKTLIDPSLICFFLWVCLLWHCNVTWACIKTSFWLIVHRTFFRVHKHFPLCRQGHYHLLIIDHHWLACNPYSTGGAINLADSCHKLYLRTRASCLKNKLYLCSN